MKLVYSTFIYYICSIENKIKNLYEQGLTMQNIANQLNISSATVYKKLNKMNVSIRRKHSNIDETYFDNPNTEKAAYWAGFIAADGYINTYKKGNAQYNVMIEISQKDKSHLEKLAQDIGKRITDYDKRNSCKLNLTSNHICNKLNEYNITPKKSLTLQFPTNIDNTYIHHYIRGYIDGDGSLYNTYEIIGNKDFLQDMINTIPFQCKYTIRQQRQTDNCWLLYISTYSLKQFAEYIYKDATIYMERKKY